MQGEQILIIGHSTWDRWRQTHEFAVRLALQNRVIFVEKFCTPADLRWQGLSWINIISRLAPQKPRPVNDNLAVLYPPVVLPRGISILSRLWGKEIMRVSITLSRSLAARWLRWELHRVGFHPTVLLIAYPFDLLLAGRLGERVSCFYVYDELALFQPQSLYADLVDEFERRYINRVDLVFTSSQSQYEKRKILRKAVHYIPNAMNFHRFNVSLDLDIPEPNDLRQIPHPRLGYIGSSDRRIDFALLHYIATERPECSVVMYGWTHYSVQRYMDTLATFPNIYIIDTKGTTPADVPKYLKWFDIGLIPFLVTPSTNTMLPVKLFEYLALGLPVVSTNLDEVKQFSSVVACAYDKIEFVRMIEEALVLNSKKKVEQRVTVARENSWDQRVIEMNALIDGCLRESS